MIGRTGAYGYYGKAPCRGDFLRAGLTPGFVSAWDARMQALMLAGREALGARWHEAYLGAPIWRFAVSAGPLGASACAGIMMPSVDRVGRQFPLCLVREVEGSAWQAFRALEPVFARLEDAALAMLEDDAAPSRLAEALAELPAPCLTTSPRALRAGDAIALAMPGDASTALAALAATDPVGLWMTEHAGQTRLLLVPDLPEGPELAATIFDLDAPAWGQRPPTKTVS